MYKKLAIFACVATGMAMGQEMNADHRLKNSAAVVTEMMGMPEKGIPQSLLDKAQCIVISSGPEKSCFSGRGVQGWARLRFVPESRARMGFAGRDAN